MSVNFSRFILGAFCVLTAMTSACSSKSAEEKGAEMATEKLNIAKGIGDVLEKKGSDTAESLSTGVGSVFKGIGKGVEKSGRSIAMKDSVARAGLKITKVQDATATTDGSAVHALEAYVVATTNVQGKLRVIAYDILNNEMGRSKATLVSEADDAKYVTFPFDPQVKLSSISKVEFDLLAETALAANAKK